MTHGAHDVPPRARPPPPRRRRPSLDADQQRVVDHAGGPLLVLAGPGTGKTTTLVEAIADRIERRGVDPSQVLALTFSRKAAEQLRDRVTARLGRTTVAGDVLDVPLLRLRPGPRATPRAELYAAPLRLLSAPEQDVVLRELLTDARRVRALAGALRAAVGTRGFAARGAVGARAGPREGPRPRRPASRSGEREGRAGVRGGGPVPRAVPHSPRLPDSLRLRRPDRAGRLLGRRAPRRAASPVRARLRRRVPGHRPRARSTCSAPWPATVATSSSSATPTSRSTASAAPTCAASSTSRPRSPRATARPRRSSPLGTTRRFGPRLLRAVAARSPAVDRRHRRDPRSSSSARSATRAPTRRPAATAGSRCCTFDTARAETEHVADLLRRAHLEDGVGWSEMAVLVRSGRTSHPAAAPLAHRGRGPGRGVQRRDAAGARARGAAAARRAAGGRRPRRRRPRRPRLRRRRPGGGAADLAARRSRRPRPARRSARALRDAATPTYPRRELVRRAVTVDRASSTTCRGEAADRGPPHRGPGPHGREPVSTPARAPSRCSGRSGTAPTGAPAPPPDRARAVSPARLAHRDLDAICALFEAAARVRGAGRPRRAARSSSTRSPPRRSRPTRSPTAGSAARRSAC